MNIEWFYGLSPVLQGLFGGAGATLLWELVLRPARARRAVARVLAEEVSLALESCAAARLQLNLTPRAIPGDFQVSVLAFNAISSDLGELPSELIGETVLFYHHIGLANAIPKTFGETIDRLNGLASSCDTGERQSLSRELDQTLVVYRGTLEKLVGRCNSLLPKLRRTAVPLWRIDYLFKRKKLLIVEELNGRVRTHNAKARADLSAS
jgi:hypothetical protein